MNTRSMTRRREEAIISTIKNTFDELRLSRYATPISATTTIVPHKHSYNLRPRKNISYVEYVENNVEHGDSDEYYNEFIYVDDVKDPDYVPYVHFSSSVHNKPQLPHLITNKSSSLRTNISSFITEVNASSIIEDGLHSQKSQNNNGVSRCRLVLRSSVKK